MYSTEPLSHFVDDYLAYLHESHPTQATLDGVHLHDDLLEDLSRSGIDARARELGGFSRRLSAIGTSSLTPVEQLERPAIEANIKSRLFEFEDVRSWETSPQYYAELLAKSLATQVILTFAPPAERARRVLSKLRQTPRLITAARENVKEPPGIFIKNGLEMMRGAIAFIETDLPRAFGDLGDLHLLGDLADASTEAVASVGGYIEYLEKEVAPRTRASFRLGRERFERKLVLEEGISLGVDRLLAVALRELRNTQDEFRRTASRLEGGGDAVEAWRRAKGGHPAAGGLVSAARAQLDELAGFVERRGLVTVPKNAGVIVAPTPRFYRWTFASLWAPGPFESHPVPAYYYITDVDPSWRADRQEQHLRDFNDGTLWAISIHEVFPGHFLHSEHLRHVSSKLRKSTMFATRSFVEGWAHYAEQMMIEAGFGRGDDTVRLGQLAEALVRLARLVVGIRLHAEDLSVEQGVRFFRDEALLEEANARREAERGTFDPSYVVYALGKLMLQKLRRDYEANQEGRFFLRAFHDALLANGSVPLWLHRRLLLGDGVGTLLDD